MERSVLIAGKEYPDGRDFAIAATRHKRRAVITVSVMPEGLDEGKISDRMYPALWSRNSPLAVRSLLLQTENICTTVDEAVLVFDTGWYAPRFMETSPEACSKAIDTMISSYTHLITELLSRFRRKGGGTLVFVIKKPNLDDVSSSKPISLLAGMAEGAFKGLGESIALACCQEESLKVVLTKADYGTADSQFANWLFEVLDAQNTVVGKTDPKKGPQWYKMGAKTGKAGSKLLDFMKKKD